MKNVLFFGKILGYFCLKIVDSVCSNTSQAHAGKSFSKVLMTSVTLTQVWIAAAVYLILQKHNFKEKYEMTNFVQIFPQNLYKHLWTTAIFKNKTVLQIFDKSPFDTLKSE